MRWTRRLAHAPESLNSSFSIAKLNHPKHFVLPTKQPISDDPWSGTILPDFALCDLFSDWQRANADSAFRDRRAIRKLLVGVRNYLREQTFGF